MKKIPFKPRNLKDETPPFSPSIIMQDCYCSNCGKGGVSINGNFDVYINGLTTRNQKNPLTIKKTRRVYLQNLDFS